MSVKSGQLQLHFDKSISLNWWCEPPSDFNLGIYDHATEVYFVGKLFEKFVIELDLEHFKYKGLLARMYLKDPILRINSFADAQAEVHREKASDITFYGQERSKYTTFADAVTRHLTKIEAAAKYKDDLQAISRQLELVYRSCMLEEKLSDSSVVLSAFIRGGYSYRKAGFPTSALKAFIDLLRSASMAKQRIIIANIYSRLDAVTRYESEDDDDIPF